MPNDIDTIKEIARASLMPDFFAVRIDEEKLFPLLKQLIAKLKLPSPLPKFEKIRGISATSSTPTEFIDAVKAQNLWSVLRDVLTQVQIR
jgi:hypothetical protein